MLLFLLIIQCNIPQTQDYNYMPFWQVFLPCQNVPKSKFYFHRFWHSPFRSSFEKIMAYAQKAFELLILKNITSSRLRVETFYPMQLSGSLTTKPSASNYYVWITLPQP